VKPIPCPTCKKQVAPDEKTFPFCSQRCRLVDLGNWLDGKYAVAGEEQGSRDDDSTPKQKH
jgi:endogenous inhibitor of DNA gyrase (YacG/DUF329 family)